MYFITVQGVRINVSHIAHFTQRRDGVIITFVQGNDLMVPHATVEEIDKAINNLAQALHLLQIGYAR